VRLFLALTPPPGVRTQLGKLADIARARCGGRRIPDENLHLTLAFLGELDEERAASLVEWTRSFCLIPGEWQLDSWGSFQGPRILWVGGRSPDPALLALHGSLQEGLAWLGLTGNDSRFTPHVSLLRKVERLETRRLPDIHLDWPYRRLELIRSITDERGARYFTLAHSLTG
jgi:2'-5' RNA ligase